MSVMASGFKRQVNIMMTIHQPGIIRPGEVKSLLTHTAMATEIASNR
jgi:hypothetical protein